MKDDFLKEYAVITLGIILVAISVEYFYAPNNLAAGGITGVAIIINAVIPKFSVGEVTLVFNLFLFIVAFVFINGDFGIRTLYATMGLSVSLWFIEKFFNPYAFTDDLIMATIFGTLISAVGMALIFYQNASTGGTDIIAKILNIFFHIDIGKSLLIVDFFITVAGMIVFGVNIGLYALLSVILLGIMIDRIIEGFNICKSVMIISDKNMEISDFIMQKLTRGCTFLRASGAYSGNKNDVIYTVLGRNEFIKLKRFIKETDPDAFIAVGEVHEVLGQGFSDIKKP
ncbi:YitT family protein [Clostridium sp. BJN0001]|uniref:YitT family protein n=1 Tax=Clostridium sp. BJN0001 TaxID=2930219 RepID=UPI001FCFCE09|nr:YitT family protein [Clostridium sp. BJN0001]